jgi:hypothetical protein
MRCVRRAARRQDRKRIIVTRAIAQCFTEFSRCAGNSSMAHGGSALTAPARVPPHPLASQERPPQGPPCGHRQIADDGSAQRLEQAIAASGKQIEMKTVQEARPALPVHLSEPKMTRATAPFAKLTCRF